MPSSIINSDDGVISGTSGLKSTGGDDGVLKLQTKGTDAVTVNATQVVSLANALPAGSGGTGANTLTAEAVIIGNGTSAVKFVAAGTSGNVLTSNGTAWLSQAISAGGDYIMTVFTTPGTWTKPAGLKAIKVTVVGGGGSGGPGGTNPNSGIGIGGGGGAGGASIEYIDAPAIPGPQPVTVGTGGTAPGGAGNTSSFGGPTAFLSATGGSAGASLSTSNTGSANGGAGGAGSNGNLNITGGGGSFGMSWKLTDQNDRYATGGAGGNSILGGGGQGGGTGQQTDLQGLFAGVAGGAYGAGGSGGAKVNSTPSPAGGAGAAGVVIVEEFY